MLQIYFDNIDKINNYIFFFNKTEIKIKNFWKTWF